MIVVIDFFCQIFHSQLEGAVPGHFSLACYLDFIGQIFHSQVSYSIVDVPDKPTGPLRLLARSDRGCFATDTGRHRLDIRPHCAIGLSIV